MPYDAESRITSLSFERKADEHVRVMVETGRRFADPGPLRLGWLFLVGAVALGIATGLGLELYRRYLLVPIFGDVPVPPFTVVALLMLPFLILIGLALYVRHRITLSRQRKALEARFGRSQFIDVDVYRDGVTSSAGGVMLTIDWTAVKDVRLADWRVDIETDDMVLYLPQRAFSDRGTFLATADRLRAVWRDAQKRDSIFREK